jgi:hypothetical protein
MTTRLTRSIYDFIASADAKMLAQGWIQAKQFGNTEQFAADVASEAQNDWGLQVTVKATVMALNMLETEFLAGAL